MIMNILGTKRLLGLVPGENRLTSTPECFYPETVHSVYFSFRVGIRDARFQTICISIMS